MKIVAISLLSFAMMGLLVPSALGEVFINDEKFYPFSIEYPSGWHITLEDSVTREGVMIDKDKTGRNGITIFLWKDIVDDPNAADYQVFEFMKDVGHLVCDEATYEEHYGICNRYGVYHTTSWEVDGFRAFTIFEKYHWLPNGEDPLFPNSVRGDFAQQGTMTFVLVGNDAWVIATGNDVEEFDELETMEIIQSFKLKDIQRESIPQPQPQPKSWFDGILDFFKSLFG